MQRKIRREAHPNIQTGQNTIVADIQAQPAAHRSKAVASGASQGAPAPKVRPHPRRRLSGPHCSDVIINAKGGRLHRYFHV
jgi:hypothetical protein